MEIRLTLPDPLPLLEEDAEVYTISIDKPSNPNVKMNTSIQFTMVYGREGSMMGSSATSIMAS